jgi:hypothetical protein
MEIHQNLLFFHENIIFLIRKSPNTPNSIFRANIRNLLLRAVNDNELEQINCQPKTEVFHANISAKPIITHNHMYNEYPKHNRERHKDINLTEKTNRAIRVNTGTLFEDTAEPQPTSIYWRNY